MNTMTRDSWHVGRAHFGQFTFTVVVTDGGVREIMLCYLKVTIICSYIFCDFGLNDIL